MSLGSDSQQESHKPEAFFFCYSLSCGDADWPPPHSPSSCSWIRVVSVRLCHSKATLSPFMNNKHYFVGEDFDTVKYPQTLNLLIHYLFQHGLVVSYFIQCYCFIYFDVRFAPDLTTTSPFKPASVALWPSHSILWALPCFLAQLAHLILFLHQPYNQLLLHGALALCRGEWCYKSSSEHQAVPLPLAVAASRPFQWTEPGNTCTHTTIFISVSSYRYQKSWVHIVSSIPIRHSRVHSVFLSVL